MMTTNSELTTDERKLALLRTNWRMIQRRNEEGMIRRVNYGDILAIIITVVIVVVPPTRTKIRNRNSITNKNNNMMSTASPSSPLESVSHQTVSEVLATTQTPTNPSTSEELPTPASPSIAIPPFISSTLSPISPPTVELLPEQIPLYYFPLRIRLLDEMTDVTQTTMTMTDTQQIPTRRILELITARDWPAVLERCRTHPNDVHQHQQQQQEKKECYEQQQQQQQQEYHNQQQQQQQQQQQEVPPFDTSTPHQTNNTTQQESFPIRRFGYDASPLHLSCLCRAPADVIMCLFHANPHAIFLQDSEGWTPLHELLKLSMHSYRHEMVLLPLIDTWGHRENAGLRNSSLHTAYGYTPLHVACQHNAPSLVVRNLLQAHPAMCCAVDENGETPAYILWDKYIRQLKNRVTLTRVGRRGKVLFQDNDLRGLLEKMGLLFQAAAVVASQPHPDLCPSIPTTSTTTSAVKDDSSTSTTTEHTAEEAAHLASPTSITPLPTPPMEQLHIIDLKNHENDPFAKRLPHYAVEFCDLLCLQCNFLYLLFRLYPEQLLEPDLNDHNRLPLHKAAAWTQKRSFVARRSQRRLRKVSFRRSSANDVVLEELLRACPQAAEVRDGDGRLPLYLAIETGKEHGIPLIFFSYPNALMTRDSTSRLFPFMYAACRKECAADGSVVKEGDVVESLTSLTAIYKLLRLSPDQIRGGGGTRPS